DGMSARMVALAAAFAFGAVASSAIAPGAPASVAAAIVAVACLSAGAVAARRAHALAWSAAILAAFALAFGLAGLRLASLERAALAAGGRDRADATLQGQVLGRPAASGGSLRFAFGVAHAEIDGRPMRVRERVLVTIRPPPARWPRAGDLLTVDAGLAPVRRPPTSPRRAEPEAAAALRLRNEGIAARAYARDVRVTGRSRNPLIAVAAAGQHAAEAAIAALPPREGGLLLGVTVGDTVRLDPDTEANFRATGLSHLLAVSGGNLAMFLGAILAILGVVRARIGTRIAVLSVATLAFMAITRFEPSVLRAGAMTAIGIGGLAAGARARSLHTLAAGCLGLMVWDPLLVHSGGFQLSALATFGLLVIAPRLRRAMGGGTIAAAAAVSLGAQLAVGPLIALRFHETSLVALPANMLAVPAVGPATVIGFVASALATVAEPAGRVVALAAYPFLWWMESVAATLARIPGASIRTPDGPAALIVVGASIGLIAGAMRMRRLRAAPLLIGVLIVASFTVWSRAVAPVLPSGLRVIALDVGQGDATLVRAPNGATMLVDGGPDEALLIKRLRAHGVRRIDVVVLTHPHTDHLAGLFAAIERLPIGRAIDAGEEATQDIAARWDEYPAALAARGVPRVIVRAPARFALGEATVDVLGPREMMRGSDADVNNNSIVLRVRYGSACALLGGEVQEEGQDALLRDEPALRCGAFKVPHHGSARALREFYAATRARIALVSVGANRYGHPAIAPMRWAAELGMRILRTDIHGDVTVTLGREGGFHVVTNPA
ncbi:MAG TPA: ComEC/Rec2 family competence protein, partial [Actinomycetota bacterium]|nr:ComEC/Rec2 family competence protein [Actinomycetota bacterium]